MRNVSTGQGAQMTEDEQLAMATLRVRLLWPCLKDSLLDEHKDNLMAHQFIKWICVQDEWAGPRCGCTQEDRVEHVFGDDDIFSALSAFIVAECLNCAASWLWASP